MAIAESGQEERRLNALMRSKLRCTLMRFRKKNTEATRAEATQTRNMLETPNRAITRVSSQVLAAAINLRTHKS